MGIIYTGMQRATELMIDKTIAGSSLEGYPRTYRLGDSFGNHIAMTNVQLAEMPIVDYQSRLAAFKTYVESIENGVIIELEDAYRENLTECPINQLS